MQLSPRNLNFRLQAFVAFGLAFLFGAVAFLPQGEARGLTNDPNALQKIQEFIYKPKPNELLLKPQGQTTKSKKPAKNAKQ